MRSNNVCALLLVCVGTFALAPPAAADSTNRRDREIASIVRARRIVTDKLADRRRHLERTLARTYQLLRPRPKRAWVDPLGPLRRVRRRGWIRRVVRIQRDEYTALADELAHLDRALLEVEQGGEERMFHGVLAAPVSGALVSEYGRYRHPSGAILFRHGVSFRAQVGESVRAPLAGVVRYVGPIRGLGDGLVIEEPGGILCVLAGLEVGVSAGDSVVREGELGRALVGEIHLELRSPQRGKSSFDPRPYLPQP